MTLWCPCHTLFRNTVGADLELPPPANYKIKTGVRDLVHERQGFKSELHVPALFSSREASGHTQAQLARCPIWRTIRLLARDEDVAVVLS